MLSCLLSLTGAAATPPQVDIDTVEKFESLRATEQQYFTDMVKKCKDSGARAASHWEGVEGSILGDSRALKGE